MPLELEILIEQILPAAAASGLVLAILWRWRSSAWPAAIAVAAGFLTGFLAMTGGVVESWPTDSTGFVVHFALAALVLRLVASSERVPWTVLGILRVGLAVAVPWLLLRSLAVAPWEGFTGKVWWWGGIAVGVLASWSWLEWRGGRFTGAGLPLALLVTAGLGSQALVTAHSARLGQQAAIVSACLGPAVLLGWLRSDSRLARGAASIAGLLLPALWLAGHLFADLPAWSAILLTAAPLPAFGRWWWAGLPAAALAGAAWWLSHDANPPFTYDY